MKKIAFQISGELRNWETGSKLFKRIKEFLEEGEEISVDFYLHAWENEYSLEVEKAGLFDFLNDYSLSNIPDEGVAEYKPKKDTYSNYVHALGLFPWSFSMYQASKIRRNYQSKNNIKYDYIVICRPDSYFYSHMVNRFKKELTFNRPPADEFFFTLFRINIYKNMTNPYGWVGFRGDDSSLVGTEEAINLYSTNFHMFYIEKNHSIIPMYHNLPGLTAMKYNMHVTGGVDGLNMKATILRKNDGVYVSQAEKNSILIEDFYK